MNELTNKLEMRNAPPDESCQQQPVASYLSLSLSLYLSHLLASNLLFKCFPAEPMLNLPNTDG